MQYESARLVPSKIEPGVQYRVIRMSFARRMELMRAVRDLASRQEFLAAGESTGDKMDATLVQAEIDRAYLHWGLQGVSGLVIDGEEASPERLVDAGPEALCREALEAVKAETGLTEVERKNS
jgi:hypothetical protein